MYGEEGVPQQQNLAFQEPHEPHPWADVRSDDFDMLRALQFDQQRIDAMQARINSVLAATDDFLEALGVLLCVCCGGVPRMSELGRSTIAYLSPALDLPYADRSATLSLQETHIFSSVQLLRVGSYDAQTMGFLVRSVKGMGSRSHALKNGTLHLLDYCGTRLLLFFLAVVRPALGRLALAWENATRRYQEQGVMEAHM